jgi:hypothetical protein
VATWSYADNEYVDLDDSTLANAMSTWLLAGVVVPDSHHFQGLRAVALVAGPTRKLGRAVLWLKCGYDAKRSKSGRRA